MRVVAVNHVNLYFSLNADDDMAENSDLFVTDPQLIEIVKSWLLAHGEFEILVFKLRPDRPKSHPHQEDPFDSRLHPYL